MKSSLNNRYVMVFDSDIVSHILYTTGIKPVPQHLLKLKISDLTALYQVVAGHTMILWVSQG